MEENGFNFGWDHPPELCICIHTYACPCSDQFSPLIPTNLNYKVEWLLLLGSGPHTYSIATLA